MEQSLNMSAVTFLLPTAGLIAPGGGDTEPHPFQSYHSERNATSVISIVVKVPPIYRQYVDNGLVVTVTIRPRSRFVFVFVVNAVDRAMWGCAFPVQATQIHPGRETTNIQYIASTSVYRTLIIIN